MYKHSLEKSAVGRLFSMHGMEFLAPTRAIARLYVGCAVLLTITFLIDVLFNRAWWSLGGVLVFSAATYQTSHHLATLSPPRLNDQRLPTSEHNEPQAPQALTAPLTK